MLAINTDWVKTTLDFKVFLKFYQVVKESRPWQDSNLQSPVSETDALSIRPQGRCVVMMYLVVTLEVPVIDDSCKSIGQLSVKTVPLFTIGI